MAKRSPSGQLDKVVSAFLGRPDAPVLRDGGLRSFDPSFGPVIEVIRALKNLPRADFRVRLKADVERRASLATATKAVPEFRAAATPYLSIRNAASAIEFYKKAFGATEEMRLMQPDGRIGHAEINIGGARLMLADEFPEIGFRSPESLGGSPVHIHLDVADVDAMAQRAIAAGATVVRPVADQFYGDRSGQLRDPFGYTWVVSTHKETLSAEEMQRRNDELSRQQSVPVQAQNAAAPAKFMREGFHSITPYLIITGAAQWIDFAKRAFDAEEHLRVGRPGTEDVLMHAEVKIGDSMIELADANPEFPAMPATLLLRVSDPDAAYNRAVEAGGTPFDPVTDHDYGSRGGTVVDRSGNRLHIFTPVPSDQIFKDFGSVTPHLYAESPAGLIDFLKTAFGGEEVYRAQMPDGSIPHAQVRIGDSIVALAGGQGPYQPMPSTLHLYVPDTDSAYERALRAGATSIQPPANQSYGERNAGVRDPFGNRWFLATHLPDVPLLEQTP